MTNALELPHADVDSPESIPAECAQGPASEVYQLQIVHRQASQHYAFVSESLARTQDSRVTDSMAWYNHPEAVAARKQMDEAREQMLKAQATIGGRVFCVAEDNMEKVEKKVAALNKRADRTGSSPIVFTKTNEQILLHYTYYQSGETSDSADFLHTYCVLSGGAPKVEGFTFIATIEHTDQGNLVNRVPTEGYVWREQTQGRNLSEETLAQEITSLDLTKYRTTPPFCEHCNKVRDRKETFIIVNHETGEVKQIGRSCLRDYTGIDDPNRLVKNIEQYFEIDRFMRARGETPTLTMVNFLTHCAAVMRDYGEYPKGLGYKAIGNYNSVGHFDQRTGEKLWIPPTDSDQADARVILHWALNEWTDDNEFASNCKVALSQPSIAATTFKNRPAGLAGAVFSAKQRWNNRQAQAAQEVGKERGFLGQVKERISAEVTVLKRSPRYTDYGTGYTLRMEDERGNIVVWFASNLPRVKEGDYPFPVEGGRYIIKGTVSQHQDHERFGKSTIIKRGSFEQTLSLPPQADIDEQENVRREDERYR